jgi:hypothetical protein
MELAVPCGGAVLLATEEAEEVEFDLWEGTEGRIGSVVAASGTRAAYIGASKSIKI